MTALRWLLDSFIERITAGNIVIPTEPTRRPALRTLDRRRFFITDLSWPPRGTLEIDRGTFTWWKYWRVCNNSVGRHLIYLWLSLRFFL